MVEFLLLFSCGAVDGAATPASSEPDSGWGDDTLQPDPDPGSDSADTDTPVDTDTDTPVDTDTDTVVEPPVPQGCITATDAGHHVFECDGIDVDIEVPERCLSEACGLIVDVHGLTMDAQMQDNNTEMRSRGRDRGYIVIQPNANGEPPTSSWEMTDDEIVHAAMMLAESVWSTDPDRKHFMGFSQGGFMTWRMLCKYAEDFASVAPGAACYDPDSPWEELRDPYNDCAFEGDELPANEVDVLYMHGTLDTINTYGCAPGRIDVLGELWSLDDEQVVEEGDHYTLSRRTSPSTGTEVEFYSHNYSAYSWLILGHCVPGSTDYWGGEPGQIAGFACTDASEFTWGERVIDFFDAHPR